MCEHVCGEAREKRVTANASGSDGKQGSCQCGNRLTFEMIFGATLKVTWRCR